MKNQKIATVTGAFGYLGKYIARELIARGYTVRTITGHPTRQNEFGGKVEAFQFDFDNPEKLVEHLKGSSVLINTYWVRFNKGDTTYDRAVRDTFTLIDAAKAAGVERFVHTSITNPSLQSRFPYFKGKAEIEERIKASGMTYGIFRPTVLFGDEDILVNNIAYLLRVLPVFGVIGSGGYKIQPVYVADAAKLAVDLAERTDNVTVDAVGPETFSFRDMVNRVKDAIGSRALVVGIPAPFAWVAGKILGFIVGDVLITWDEVGGLSAGLLVSYSAPTCPTRFSDWIGKNADKLGKRYASEVDRHYK